LVENYFALAFFSPPASFPSKFHHPALRAPLRGGRAVKFYESIVLLLLWEQYIGRKEVESIPGVP
jgi:hypothetical protein